MRLTIAQAIEKLKTPGTYFSGADWKWGWPHKFYLGASDKVYNEDLKLLPDDKVKEYSDITKEFFGVEFFRIPDGRMHWRCEWADTTGMGYQRAGRVGINGEPNRTDEWNPDFPGKPVN